MRLVERAQKGDKGAIGELYRAHVDMVYRYIYARVGDVGAGRLPAAWHWKTACWVRVGNWRPLAVLERGFRKEVTPKEGGDSIKGNGEFSTILQRRIDGSWKIAIDCFNYDAPLG